MYFKILKLRKQIKSNYKDFHDIFEDTCPLCGKKYKNNELLKSIKEYSDEFENLQVYINTEITQMEENENKQYLILKHRIDELTDLKYFNSKAFKILKEIKKNENSYIQTKIEDLERKLDIKIKNFICNNNDIDNSVEKLKYYLEDYLNKEKSKLLLNENLKKEYDAYYIMYKEFFNSNINRLELMENKLKLLNWYKNNKEIQNNSDIVKQHSKLKDEYRQLLIIKEKLSIIRRAVSYAEKKYKEELIKYIKIPLYIYSGKLLQTHQNGLGVFCDTGTNKDQLTRIKFVSSKKGDQDLITKFSAGQMSILTIASLLAFRKITKTSLKVLMIDDPCQTMDELNIASLAEILRNEFKDTQIIISTHEDSIAAYIAYKYFKYGKSYNYFNVKNNVYEYFK